MFTVMIVEDDDKIAGIVAADLERYGYKPLLTREFADIKGEFIRLQPDVVLLDINLPHFDGFYWCRQLRTLSTVPVIFISARVGEMDQVLAIENGGDDYLTKPFSLEVLRAKLRSVLRRAYGEYANASDQHGVHQIGRKMLLDDSRNRLVWQEQQLELPTTEYRLLRALAVQTGNVVSREDLLAALWDDVDFVDDNTLSVNVARLRRRLDDLGLCNAIETWRGQGYSLRLPTDEAR